MDGSILKGGEGVIYMHLYYSTPLLNIRELVLQLGFFTLFEIFTEDATSSILVVFENRVAMVQQKMKFSCDNCKEDTSACLMWGKIL